MEETVMEKAKKVVSKIGKLPSMPSIIMKVMAMLNEPHTTVKEIQSQILLDPALTAFILKVANSPFYGLKKEVNTVSFAVNLLGFNLVKSILVTYLTKDLYQSEGNQMISRVLWKHSVAAGVFGRNIAKHFKKVNMEETFIACLLHDIGKSVLLTNKLQDFEKVIEKVYNDGIDSYNAETTILGFTHIETGYILLKSWDLSSDIIEGVVFHHNVQDYYGDSKIIPMVSLANKLCHRDGYTFTTSEKELFELKVLDISQTDISEIVAISKQEIEDYMELMR